MDHGNKDLPTQFMIDSGIKIHLKTDVAIIKLLLYFENSICTLYIVYLIYIGVNETSEFLVCSISVSSDACKQKHERQKIGIFR